jgi:hypothetical protein
MFRCWTPLDVLVSFARAPPTAVTLSRDGSTGYLLAERNWPVAASRMPVILRAPHPDRRRAVRTRERTYQRRRRVHDGVEKRWSCHATGVTRSGCTRIGVGRKPSRSVAVLGVVRQAAALEFAMQRSVAPPIYFHLDISRSRFGTRRGGAV